MPMGLFGMEHRSIRPRLASTTEGASGAREIEHTPTGSGWQEIKNERNE